MIIMRPKLAAYVAPMAACSKLEAVDHPLSAAFAPFGNLL